MQRELLEERLISHAIEWCETPDVRVSGVAYNDVTVLYDVDGVTVSHRPSSAANNVYLHIPHPLLDPVLEDAVSALRRFFLQTFWANNAAFDCCQAEAAVCMHICNAIVNAHTGSHLVCSRK